MPSRPDPSCHSDTPDVDCVWCGEVIGELDRRVSPGESEEIECPHCGEMVRIAAYVSVEYGCWPVKR